MNFLTRRNTTETSNNGVLEWSTGNQETAGKQSGTGKTKKIMPLKNAAAKAFLTFAAEKNYSVYSCRERTSIVPFCKASIASTTDTAPDMVV